MNSQRPRSNASAVPTRGAIAHGHERFVSSNWRYGSSVVVRRDGVARKVAEGRDFAGSAVAKSRAITTIRCSKVQGSVPVVPLLQPAAGGTFLSVVRVSLCAGTVQTVHPS